MRFRRSPLYLMLLLGGISLSIGVWWHAGRKKEAPMSNSIAAYVAYENGLIGGSGLPARGNNGVWRDYAGIAPVGSDENSVIGWQSSALPTPAGAYNAVVLDGDRYYNAIEVDATGSVTITDESTGNPTSGQSITVTGATYLVFNAGGADPAAANAYPEEYIVLNGTDSGIAALYNAALGRIPDQGGLEFWINSYNGQVASGLASQAALENIAQGFLSSAEFKANIIDPVNSTNLAFATALYTNVLGRTPDAGGLAYWVTQLNNGQPRYDTLLGFAESKENLNDITVGPNGGWLIDTAQGGYADPATPIPAQTFLTQGLADGYFNLGDVSSTGSTIERAGPLTLVDVSQGGFFTAGYSNFTIKMSTTGVNSVSDFDNGDIIYGASAGSSNIGIGGNNTTIFLAGAGNFLTVAGVQQSYNASGISTGTLIYGFGAGDVVEFGPFAGAYYASIFTPTSTLPIQGASVTFYVPETVNGNGQSSGGYFVTNAINLGNVGTGTAAEVAAAANKVYVVADVINEAILFYGQTATGTVMEWWGTNVVNSATPSTADSNGNHLVDPGEFTASVTLIGVQASSITTAELGAVAQATGGIGTHHHW